MRWLFQLPLLVKRLSGNHEYLYIPAARILRPLFLKRGSGSALGSRTKKVVLPTTNTHDSSAVLFRLEEPVQWNKSNLLSSLLQRKSTKTVNHGGWSRTRERQRIGYNIWTLLTNRWRGPCWERTLLHIVHQFLQPILETWESWACYQPIQPAVNTKSCY